MFSVRYLSLVALLASCTVYNQAMRDDADASDGAAGSTLIRSGGSSSSAHAGTTSLGGSTSEISDPSGGDDTGTPSSAGTAMASGGASGGSGAALGGTGPSGGGKAGMSSTAGTTTTMAGSSTGSGGMPSLPAGVDMLDDMEDGNFYLSPKPPRYGYWYVSGDTTVGGKLPKIENLIVALSPARGSSKSAVHFTASGFTGWGSSVGVTFMDVNQKRTPYDAGNALGISFWVRGSVTDNAKLKVQLPLLGTDPSGTLCGAKGQGDCLDHFATQIDVTSEWQQVPILFSSLHQAGWGVALDAFDPKQLLGIEWSAGIQNLDIWIDDLALIRPE